MATTIQIVVAGLLLLAWVAVLGRPAGARERAADDLEPSTGDGLPPRPDQIDHGDQLLGLELPAFLRPRHHIPLTQRRRQRLLATMFATFASFFLAVAFRGTFVQLLLVMLVALTVHLGIAARVGGQIVAEQRRARVEAAKRAARARARAQSGLFDHGPRIGAGRAGEQTLGDHRGRERAIDHAAAAGRSGRSGDRHHADDGDDPFDLAVEMASALDAAGRSTRRPEDLVSDLIDQAWAEPEPEPEPEEEPVGEPARSRRSDALFTRPMAGARNRFRRSRKRKKSKAQPIEIESELDGDYPTAVNHR